MNFKQIFLTTSFLVISNFSFAQVWSLNELIKVSNMNIDDADTFASSKGYALSQAKDEDGQKRIYSFDRNSSEQKSSYWFNYMVYPSYSKYKLITSWETNKTEQYANFKKQIKPAGFAFKSSKVREDGSTISEYIKGKYLLEIWIVDRSEEYHQHVIQYVISITVLK
jgi:hypothetical protein